MSPFSCAITARSLSISDDAVREFPNVIVGFTGVVGVTVWSALAVSVFVVLLSVVLLFVVLLFVVLESVTSELVVLESVTSELVVVSELLRLKLPGHMLRPLQGTQKYSVLRFQAQY